MRTFALMLVALLAIVTTGPSAAVAEDELPTISAEDWADFIETVKADEDYAPRLALKQELMEPRLQTWQAETGALLRAEWANFFDQETGFSKPGDERGVGWSIEPAWTRGDVSKLGTWTVSRRKSGDRTTYAVSGEKVGELNFTYLVAVHQLSPMDSSAPEIAANNRPASELIGNLCDLVDADHALPDASAHVTVHLRNRTVRKAIQMICQAAGWKVQIDDGLRAQQQVGVFTAKAINLVSSGKFDRGEMTLEEAVPAALRQLVGDYIRTLKPGDICVTAEIK